MTLYNLLTLFIYSSLLWKIFTSILLLETRVGYIFFSEQCHVTVVASAFTLPRVKTRTSISRLTVPVRTKTSGSDALHRVGSVSCARGKQSEIDYQKSRKWIDSDTERRWEGVAPCWKTPLTSASDVSPSKRPFFTSAPSEIVRLKVIYVYNSWEKFNIGNIRSRKNLFSLPSRILRTEFRVHRQLLPIV